MEPKKQVVDGVLCRWHEPSETWRPCTVEQLLTELLLEMQSDD